MELGFSIFTAIIQGFFLVGAIQMALFGLLCLGGMFYRPKGSYKVRARIIGLRSSDGSEGAIYYPVYEYTSRENALMRADSDSGSSGYTPDKIGQFQNIYIDPEFPERAITAGPILLIIGTILLSVGFGMGYFALGIHPFDKVSAVITSLIFLYTFFKIFGRIKPRHMRETMEAFRARKYNEFKSDKQSLTFHDRRSAEQIQRKQLIQQSKAAPVLYLISLGLLGFASWHGFNLAQKITSGTATTGIVTTLSEVRSSDGITYAPIVEYAPLSGQTLSFKDSFSSSPAAYAIGEQVAVIYNPDQPEIAMIDRGWKNWILTSICAGLGLLILSGAVKVSRASQRI